MKKILGQLAITSVFASAIVVAAPLADVPLKAAGLSVVSTAQACAGDPCLHHEPRVIIQKVYIYVDRPARPPKPKKKAGVVKVSAKPVSDCEWVEFPKGYASQPVVFFRHKKDARCQKAKTYCLNCTLWINGQRGPVYGPASRTGGGTAYAVPPGTGVWLPKDNKGTIAYCDQAVGNDTYSWGLRD